MSTSSILITTQLDLSLFIDASALAVTEFLLVVCSLLQLFELVLDCPSKKSLENKEMQQMFAKYRDDLNKKHHF